MSWKYEIQPIGENKFYQNGVTFATEDEATRAGKNKFYNWMGANAFRVTEVDSRDYPVNYRWDNKIGLVSLE